MNNQVSSSKDAIINVPHPIPYQGSKRRLAQQIGAYVPENIERWYEPFAGSASMSIWAAIHTDSKQIIINDSFEPLMDLWAKIIEDPQGTASQYREIWNGQKTRDTQYFNLVRSRFNQTANPVDLLYLLCRCVKNAVRFNSKGSFTQSVDKRRLGTHPDRMLRSMQQASCLLKGRIEVSSKDWLDCLKSATTQDFIFLDPPYAGTSTGRDKRYANGLGTDALIHGLEELKSRNLRFILSYDGMMGDKTYGKPLPESLGLKHLLIDAGRSSQATLGGKNQQTFESLYLSSYAK